MGFFSKKTEQKQAFDLKDQKPVIKASICNGEKVAGFIDENTGAFHEVMLIVDNADLDEFRSKYGITGEIAKIY